MCCAYFCVYSVQATEEVSKSLVAMKEILYGTNEKEPQTEAVAQLAQELYNSGLLSTLIADLQLIDFEVRLNVFFFTWPGWKSKKSSLRYDTCLSWQTCLCWYQGKPVCNILCCGVTAVAGLRDSSCHSVTHNVVCLFSSSFLILPPCS